MEWANVRIQWVNCVLNLDVLLAVSMSYRLGIVRANTKFSSLFHLNFPLLPPFFPF